MVGHFGFSKTKTEPNPHQPNGRPNPPGATHRDDLIRLHGIFDNFAWAPLIGAWPGAGKGGAQGRRWGAGGVGEEAGAIRLRDSRTQGLRVLFLFFTQPPLTPPSQSH